MSEQLTYNSRVQAQIEQYRNTADNGGLPAMHTYALGKYVSPRMLDICEAPPAG
jgi:hypothetical protein